MTTNRYYQVFSWQNNLQPNPITVGGQVIDPGTGNTFIADSIVYEYQYSDPSVVLCDRGREHARGHQRGRDGARTTACPRI